MSSGGTLGKIAALLQTGWRELSKTWRQGVSPLRIVRLIHVTLRYRRTGGGGKGAMRKAYPHLNIAHYGPMPDLLVETRQTRIDRLPLGWIMPTQHDALIVTCPADAKAAPPALLNRIRLYQQAGKPVVVLLQAGGNAAALLAALKEPPTLICAPTAQIAETCGAMGLATLVLPPAINLQKTSPMGFPLKAREALGMVHKAGNCPPDYGGDAPRLAALSWSTPHALPHLAHKARKLLGVVCDPDTCTDPADFAQQTITLAGAGAVILYPAYAADQLAPLIGAGNGLSFASGAELAALAAELADPVARERQSVATRRHVLRAHGHKQRLESLLAQLGMPTRQAPLVSIIACTMRPDYLARFLGMIRAQDWPQIELILVTHGRNFDDRQIADLLDGYPVPVTRIACPQQMIFGACLNRGIGAARGQFLTKMDDDDFYGPGHIRDLVTAHDYANADATGKAARFIYLSGRDVLMARKGQCERRNVHVSGAAFMLSRNIARDYMFLHVAREEDRSLFQRVAGDGKCLYETHAFGFCVYRAVSGHTWVQDDEVFLSRAVRQWPGFNPDLTGIGNVASPAKGGSPCAS